MSPKAGKPATSAPAAARTAAWIRNGPRWALSLPRAGRVLLVAMFGVATTLALMPIVDGVYLNYLMALRLPVLPALISTGLGMSIYVVGWWLVVGTVGEKPVLQRVTVMYFWFGALMCLIVLALVTYGLALNLQSE